MDSSLLPLLKSCKIFSSLDDKTLNEILGKFKKITLKKNEILFKQGELSTHLYLLVSGKVILFLTTDKKEKMLISDIHPASLIGELTALSHEPRSTTAQALKKSILLELSGEEFIALCQKYPAVSIEVMNSTLYHSRNIIKLISDQGEPKKHVALIAASKQAANNVFYEGLAQHATENVVVISDLSQDEFNLSNETSNKKTYIYFIHSLDSTLAKILSAEENLDMVYVVGDGLLKKPKIRRALLDFIENLHYKIKPELILFYSQPISRPTQTYKWLKLFAFNLYHHVRINFQPDWARLMRFLTGKAYGVVLGGGGLRCWAHIGALMALERMKIPIDIIGGSSAGAIVAAYYAMKLSPDVTEDLRKLSEAARNSPSLRNVTWPAVSLFNAEEYTAALQKIFRTHRIENLWMPCFCIITNLASNKQIIARKGHLWKLIRSSTSVPLVFPPMVVQGKLHMDGGLLNNLPVDQMKKLIGKTSTVIAVELTHRREDVKQYHFPLVMPFWKTFLAKTKLAFKDYIFPNFVDTFLKALLAGASAYQEENGRLADILISPNLSEFGLLNVTREEEDRLIRIGFFAAIRQLKINSLLPQTVKENHGADNDPDSKTA